MTSWKKQLVGLVLVSGVLSIGVSACADNETSIFIRQVQTPAASPACGYTADPSSEYYTMGKLAVLKLRDDYRRKMGAQYSLQDFHDRFIALGPLPLPLVREALLGERGTLF